MPADAGKFASPAISEAGRSGGAGTYAEKMSCGGLYSAKGDPAGSAGTPERRRTAEHSARTTRSPATMVPARPRPGSGTLDDADPRLHATAAHSPPEGAGIVPVTMATPPAARGDWDNMAPGTMQLTATAATVTSSQRHLGITASQTKASGRLR